MMEKTGLFAMVLAMIGSPECQKKGPPLVGRGEKIVAIGDSITQAGGYLRAMDAVFAQQYADMQIPSIVNVGIGGQKAEDLIARFDRDVLDRKPGMVLINVGINDVWHRLDKPHDEQVLAAYKANVDRMVVMAQAGGIKVVLLSPTVIEEMASSEGNRRLALYVAAGKEVAAKRRCLYADLHALFLKAIAYNQGQYPDAGPSGRLTSDGVHMKPPGDALMAVGILRELNVPDEKIKATRLEGILED